jgi:transposase
MAYLMLKAVVRGLRRREPDQTIVHAGLDEKSFHEGHHYATVLSDLDAGRVVEVVESRTEEAATTLLNTALTVRQKASVESVSMDMWQAFANAKANVLPEADIVHDRFHISGYLNAAVDATRKDEHKRLSREDDSTLSKTKYLWLRSEGSLTEKQKAALDALSRLDLQTAYVWAFKERFRQFFECRTENDAQTFFNEWYQAAVALGNPHLTRVAKLLNNHINGLLAYIRHRVTNALAENLNGQIQRVKSNARGFRSFTNFRVAVLFFLGKLDLYPQSFR